MTLRRFRQRLRQSRLARSLPQIYAAAALRLLLPVLVLPMMAARVGAQEFGRLGFILVWAGLLAMVVEGGFLAAATRLAVVADAPRRWQLAQQVFTARCTLCAPAGLLAVAAVRWAEPAAGAAHAGVDMLAIAALACAFGWPATWYLQATEQLGRWARVEAPVLALWLGACWAWAHSVEAYVLLQLVAASVLALLGWGWLRRDLAACCAGVDGRGLWSPPQWRAGVALGWTMLPVSIAGAAYSFALPAAASSQLPKAELGVYFMADRLVRALLGAADPLFSVVYPRILARFALGGRAALRFAAGWGAGGFVGGLALFGAAALAWPWLVAQAPERLGRLDPARLQAVLQVLGWLLPLLLGWKFIGYWMLGSRRFDTAYRVCIVAGGFVGTGAALTVGGAAGAVGLARTSLAVECFVVVVAVAGIALTRRRRPKE